MSYIAYVNEFQMSYIYKVNEFYKSYIDYVNVIKIENRILEKPIVWTNLVSQGSYNPKWIKH